MNSAMPMPTGTASTIAMIAVITVPKTSAAIPK